MMDAKRRRGATLLEVVIAVSLLSFGLGAVFQSFAICTRMQSRLAERQTAARLAEALLIERLASGTAAAGDSGAFAPPFEAYSWTLRSLQSSADSPLGLVLVDVWKSGVGGRSKLCSLQTASP